MSEESPLRANERLREERIRRGWSQQKVADQLGIAVVTVNRWERGKQQPTGYYRLRLSSLFEKSVEELGLSEETNDAEAFIYTNEQQEIIGEAGLVPEEIQEELISAPSHSYDTVLNRPSVETGRAPLPLPFAYNWSDRSPRYKRKRITLLLIVMVLLIISASVTFLFIRPSVGGTAAKAKTPTQSASPVPAALATIERGTPAIHDPLTKAGGGSEWQAGGVHCSFTHNGLQMNSAGTQYCSANVSEFDNMVFKIEMLLQQGEWAGVTLRDDGQGNMYHFAISESGQYELDVFRPNVDGPTILLFNSSTAIQRGLNKWNTITVEANKSHLSFWVNAKLIAEKDDSTWTHGYLGSGVGSYNPSIDPLDKVITIAIFRNAYVWPIS